MATILITEYMAPAGRALLGEQHVVTYDPALWDQGDKLHELVGRAEALIVRNQTIVDATILEMAPNLRAVGRLGVGLDNIDTDACRIHHVQVHPAVGANAAAVAEYVIGALLTLFRGVYGSTEAMTSGNWPRETSVGREIASKQLGLVGFGGIARQVAARAQALSMTVVAHDPYVADDDPAWDLASNRAFESLLTTSDAISIHVPLTEATRLLIDGAAIANMKRGAILVNTSRGGIVEEAALAAALVAGDLGGAALDVFDREPLDASNGSRFATTPNLILTPHIAGHTEEANDRISIVVAEAVLETLADMT